MRPNEIVKVPRSEEDAQTTRQSIAESFPFLRSYPDVLDSLASWSEFYVGITDEDVDPDTYDSFSLAPLEELHWRTEWKNHGFFTVAIFVISGVETDICVTATEKRRLYFWSRDDRSVPLSIDHTIMDILRGVVVLNITLRHCGSTLTSLCGDSLIDTTTRTAA